MTETEKIADRAKIIVDGLAFEKKNNSIVVTNIHNIRYKAQLSLSGKILNTNMSSKNIERIYEILRTNMEFL